MNNSQYFLILKSLLKGAKISLLVGIRLSAKRLIIKRPRCELEMQEKQIENWIDDLALSKEIIK